MTESFRAAVTAGRDRRGVARHLGRILFRNLRRQSENFKTLGGCLNFHFRARASAIGMIGERSVLAVARCDPGLHTPHEAPDSRPPPTRNLRATRPIPRALGAADQQQADDHCRDLQTHLPAEGHTAIIRDMAADVQKMPIWRSRITCKRFQASRLRLPAERHSRDGCATKSTQTLNSGIHEFCWTELMPSE